MSAHCWALFGLNVHSDLELPFAQSQACATRDDVRVRFAAIPSQGLAITSPHPDVIQIEIEKLGRFQVSGGREIAIDPCPGASDRNLRVYLLGSVFGALLHQRGLLPLHANAIIVERQAVAFMGASGAGKSTLAAWFQDQGYTLFADDVCAISVDGEGQPWVVPGVPRVRLWRDAVLRSGRDPEELELSFDGQDKFDLPASRSAALPSLPLAGCYVLNEPDHAGPTSIVRLSGARAAEALIANTYRGKFLKMAGAAEKHFGSIVQVSRNVPVHKVERRKDVTRFDLVAAELEEHVRNLVDALPASGLG